MVGFEIRGFLWGLVFMLVFCFFFSCFWMFLIIILVWVLMFTLFWSFMSFEVGSFLLRSFGRLGREGYMYVFGRVGFFFLGKVFVFSFFFVILVWEVLGDSE